jgi:hypothetical protein
VSPRRLRIVGLACLAVPAALLLLFAVGEMAGGDLSGAQHLPEVAAVGAIGWTAWRWPYILGMVLMLGGAVLALVFVLWLHPSGITLLGIAVVELLLFIPAIAAGACFTLAGAIERGDLGGGASDEAREGAQPSR